MGVRKTPSLLSVGIPILECGEDVNTMMGRMSTIVVLFLVFYPYVGEGQVRIAKDVVLKASVLVSLTMAITIFAEYLSTVLVTH